MKHNPEGYSAVLAVVRSAWALVDNTAYHDWLPLTVSRDDWNDLVADLNTLKALIPPDELPAEPPHAVTCLWRREPSHERLDRASSAVEVKVRAPEGWKNTHCNGNPEVSHEAE